MPKDGIAFALATIGLFGLVGMFLLLGCHYWLPLILKRDVEAPESYVWGGALGIAFPYVAWLGFWWAFHAPTLPAWLAGLGFLGTVGISGLGTILAYWLDRHYGGFLHARLRDQRTRHVADGLERAIEALQGEGDVARLLVELRKSLDDERHQPPHHRTG
jgi:hypothetical protein